MWGIGAVASKRERSWWAWNRRVPWRYSGAGGEPGGRRGQALPRRQRVGGEASGEHEAGQPGWAAGRQGQCDDRPVGVTDQDVVVEVTNLVGEEVDVRFDGVQAFRQAHGADLAGR